MGVSTRRLTEPALSIQQLPALDFIVLSHHGSLTRMAAYLDAHPA
jgi:hypothetical protein